MNVIKKTALSTEDNLPGNTVVRFIGIISDYIR